MAGHRHPLGRRLRRPARNPKKIKDWEDLVKKDVDVVTPNVQTSGGAKWNVMAAYGAMRKKGKTHKQAVAYLRNLYKHVVVAGQERAGGAADVPRRPR